MNESPEQSSPPDEGGHDLRKQGAAQATRHMRRQGDGHPLGRGRRQLRADVAERLLQGEDVTDAGPRSAEVGRLLAAVRVLPPGKPQDEDKALEAFRQAAGAGSAAPPRVPVPVLRGGPWRTGRGHHPARMLVGGAVAVLTLSGVAIAAQGGALPHPFHSSGGTTRSASAPASPTSARGTGTLPGLPQAPGATRGFGTPKAHPAIPHHPGSVSPSASPAPADAAAKGLCEAYTKAERAGRTPDATVRARLAEAAGGAAGIEAYCAGLASVPSSGHGQKGAERHAAPPAVSATPDAAAPAKPSRSRRK